MRLDSSQASMRTRQGWLTAALCTVLACLAWSATALAATAPVVEEASVANVAGTSATFRAQINPEGGATTYWFEYGTSEAYGSRAPAPAGVVGSGTAGVTVSAHVQGLAPSTEYVFRVVAADGGETTYGSMERFLTQSAGGEFALPDGRQWELVSPSNKYGADLFGLGGEYALQAAAAGDAIAYTANAPIEHEPRGNEDITQVLSTRGADGWSSRDISGPHKSVTGSVVLLGLHEYQFFSEDLASALAYPIGEDRTLLSERASEPTPYVRNNGLCEAPASGNECYTPLLTAKEGFADVPSGIEFGKDVKDAEPSVEAASPDLHHMVLISKVRLTSTPISQRELYEWSADKPPAEALQLVSALPESEGGGPQDSQGCVGVGADICELRMSGARHAISDDGSRVFWGANSNEEVRLYMHDLARDETIRLDLQQPGAPAGGTPEAQFQAANAEGSRVFFTDSGQRLTAGSGVSGPDLYVCEIVQEAGRDKCDLTDLTPASGGQSAEVRNIVSGVAEDGSYVYFVANGALAPGAAPGDCKSSFSSPNETCNLYVVHYNGSAWGPPKFIATLSEEDEGDWGESDETFHFLGNLNAEASSNGRYLAFMSVRSLTGYDNRDAVTGKPAMEVYLYDAQSEKLVCASCNPTGARPVGVELRTFEAINSPNLAAVISGGNLAPSSSIAANLPPADSVGVSRQSPYQPPYVFDDGRLFFNSSDVLVPQDVDGTEDVYEYEPAGVGSCTPAAGTFSRVSGGCVSLISSGTSAEESGFVGASESGGDVFFLTTGRLTSQDYDTALDVYDAHECTAASPCVVAPVPPPPCDTADSCRPAPSPQPAVFGAPPTATFVGSGNVAVSVGEGAPAKKSALAKKKKKSRRKVSGSAKRGKRRGKASACGGRGRGRSGCGVRAAGRARAVKASGKGGR